jgi:hypothetical protein
MRACLKITLSTLIMTWPLAFAASAELRSTPVLASHPLQLALKTKPPSCVPVLCWVQNTGWCMCDPCTNVTDCRAATGEKAEKLVKPKLDAEPLGPIQNK